MSEAVKHLSVEDYERLRRLGRKIEGVSAVLLPYGRDGEIDEAGLSGKSPTTALQ